MFSQIFSKFTIPGRRKGGLQFSREDFVFWGVVSVFSLTLSLVLLDGYIFFQTLFQEREEVMAVGTFEKISPEYIEEVMRILDEREKKFNEILAR